MDYLIREKWFANAVMSYFDKKFDFDWWCDMMNVPLQKRVKLTECMMKTSVEMQEFLTFNMKIIKLYRFILKWHCLYVEKV